MRDRLPEEINPARAEQSGTFDNNEAQFGARNTIDMVLNTFNMAVPGSDGNVWLKVVLEREHCVRQVIINVGSDSEVKFTCNLIGCSPCTDSVLCYKLTLAANFSDLSTTP